MKELDDLDLKYEFCNVNNINISIGVDSLKKLNDYNIIKEINEIVDSNKYHIKEQLQNVLINRKNYVSYCKEYDLIVDKLKTDYSKNILSQLSLFFKILFYRLKRKKVKLNFKLNVLVSYRSPAGRNYYEKRFSYYYDDLVKIRSNNILNVGIPKPNKNETSKQNKQYLECNHCGRLIDFNLNVCNYCGKHQFDNSNYLKQGNSYNPKTINSYNSDNKNSFQVYDDNFFLNKKNNSNSVQQKSSNNIYNLEENKNFIIDMDVNSEVIDSSKKTNIEDNIKKYYYDFYMFSQIKVKLDDGNYFYEKFVDSLSVKRKNTKREIILLDYYRNKYLNKNINNYNIYNVRFDRNCWYDDGRSVYFDCKCNKCGRLIFQTAHNFILHPIICKCCDKKYIHLANVDLNWDKGLFPYRKRISSVSDDNDFYDIYMEEIFNLYFNNDGVINRLGFSSINESNDIETYIIGNVSIPLNDKYITFENVYYNYYMDIPEKFEYKVRNSRKNVVFNPILYFYKDNNYYSFEILKKEGLIINKKYDSFVFIYFSKEKNNYKMNVYYNDNLIFLKQRISFLKINAIYNNNVIELNSFRKFAYDNKTDDYYENITDYVFFSEFDSDSSVSGYRFNINDKTMYSYNLKNEKRKLELESSKLELKKLIDRTKIGITINIQKLDLNLKKQLESFQKIDNNKYKRIFIHNTAYETGWILYEFLKDKSEVLVLENEFLDDKSLNYCFLIEKDNREVLNFVDYIISCSRDHKSYECNIYEHSISSICNILLEKKENVDKIIDAILKDDILIFDNEEKEDYVISKLKNKITFKDYHNDYNILKFSYYKEIILELKDKYCVDDFGLLLIMLAKYGEDVVFDLNERYFIKKTEEQEFDKLYNDLLIQSNYKNPKWKKEYNLYLLIKTYFKDAIFQYNFKELGGQKIDIFIPSLNIAFEYQGEQHYVSGIFGDEADFEHSKWLDERKRKICKDNNIHLIEWHFETRVNKIELDYVLYEFKELLTDKYEFSNILKK